MKKQKLSRRKRRANSKNKRAVKTKVEKKSTTKNGSRTHKAVGRHLYRLHFGEIDFLEEALVFDYADRLLFGKIPPALQVDFLNAIDHLPALTRIYTIANVAYHLPLHNDPCTPSASGGLDFLFTFRTLQHGIRQWYTKPVTKLLNLHDFSKELRAVLASGKKTNWDTENVLNAPLDDIWSFAEKIRMTRDDVESSLETVRKHKLVQSVGSFCTSLIGSQLAREYGVDFCKKIHRDHQSFRTNQARRKIPDTSPDKVVNKSDLRNQLGHYIDDAASGKIIYVRSGNLNLYRIRHPEVTDQPAKELSISEYKKNGGPALLNEICGVQGQKIKITKQRTKAAIIEQIPKQKTLPVLGNILSVDERHLLYLMITRICGQDSGKLEACHNALRQVSHTSLLTQFVAVLDLLSHPHKPYWYHPPEKTRKLEHLIALNAYNINIEKVRRVVESASILLSEIDNKESCRLIEKVDVHDSSKFPHLENFHEHFLDLQESVDCLLAKFSLSSVEIELLAHKRIQLFRLKEFLERAQNNFDSLELGELESFTCLYKLDKQFFEQIRFESELYRELDFEQKEDVASKILRDNRDLDFFPAAKKIFQVLSFDTARLLLDPEESSLMCVHHLVLSCDNGSLLSMLDLTLQALVAFQLGILRDWKPNRVGEQPDNIHPPEAMRDDRCWYIGHLVHRELLHSWEQEGKPTLFSRNSREQLIVTPGELLTARFRWKLSHVLYGEGELIFRNNNFDTARIRPVSPAELMSMNPEKIVSIRTFGRNYNRYTSALCYKWFLSLDKKPVAVVEPITSPRILY